MSSDPSEREKVLDLLTNYGLEMEDLAMLADMPEELLTAETIPHLLKQIRKHRDTPEPPSPPPTRCAPCGSDPPPLEPIAEPPAKQLESNKPLQGISEGGNALPSLSVAAAPHNTLPALHGMLPTRSASAPHHKQPAHSTAALHHAMPVHSRHSVPALHPTLPVHSAAVLHPTLPAHSAAMWHPTLPAHSAAVSHPTLPVHSAAVSHPTLPAHFAAVSHPTLPAHSAAVSHPTLPAHSAAVSHPTLPAHFAPAPHHTLLLHSSTELPHIPPSHSAAVLHRALPIYSAPATHHALPTFFTKTTHFTLPTYSTATSHHSLPACPTPAPHRTLPLHSSAELNHILPAHSAAASHPALPKYSSAASHHTIPTYSITTSHHALPTCTATASHHALPTYSTTDTKGSTPSSSPADVPPPVGSPPEVAGISFTISRPRFPTKVEPPMSVPPPGCLSDYQGGAPDEYPYTCCLCSYQAISQTKWLAHLDYIRHVKGKIALLQRYPHWVFNELKNPVIKPTPMQGEEQRMHVRPLEMLRSRSSTSESSSSSANDRSSQRMKSQHDRRKESANAKLLAGSSDLRSKTTRDTYHGWSSTTLLVRKRQKSSEEEDSYRTNRRKEETRRRESSSEEEDRYRRRDDESSSRRRRRRGESSERENSRVDRFGRDIRGRDSGKEGSAKRRRSCEEEDKHGRKTEERRAREEEDRKRRNSGVNKDREKKNTPVQLVANTSSGFNKKNLEGDSGNKKEREGSSTTREKGSSHSGDIAKKKEIGETKETQERHEGQEKAVLEKGVTRMSVDMNKTKEDRQPFSPEMPPPVPSKDLHGARAQEEQVPSVNAGRKGSAAREKVNEKTKEEEEPGEKPVPPEEPSANSNVDLCQTTTLSGQQMCRNTDPVKNMLDPSDCNRAEEEEKEKEVKKQEHKMADYKTPDPGTTWRVIPRDNRQTGSDLGSVSAAEPPASGSESQSETPETPGRWGRRRKASAALPVDQVPRTTRRSARIHSSPPLEPDPQPDPREALPEKKPTEREGSGGREAKKHPSPVGVGNLPRKTSKGQKVVQKSSDAETVDQVQNRDDDEEAPDSVVVTKVSVVETTEEQGTVRATVTRGQGRRCPPPRRSKKPAARQTRGGTFTSSEDPSEHTTTDTQTQEEACHEAGDNQEEDMEPLVLKEAPPDTPDPSSTANIAQKDSTEAAPTKKSKTEPTLEKHPGSEAGRNSAAHKVIYGSSAAANMGQAQPPETIGEIGSQLDNHGKVPHEENNDLAKEKEKEREPVESHEEEGDETKTCDLVKPAAEEEEVKINAEPVGNSPEPHGKVHESEEEVVEPGLEPPQLEKELKPPEPAKEVPEPKVKVLQSLSVLVVELGEEVLKPKWVLESKKLVMELGAEPQQPGEEPPQPSKVELKIGHAPPTVEEAGFAERGPDLEELDDPVGTEFIHPVTGFYCSLCQVIYVREEEAKEGHCRSPSHCRMVQAHAGSKL